MAIVDLKKWKHVRVVSLWLEYKDYAKLLGIFAYHYNLTNNFFVYNFFFVKQLIKR